VIALVRIDNRLLHGQILEAWLPRLKVRRLVVADDEAASSPLARQAMTLCLPPEIQAEVAPIAAVDWAALAAGREGVLVLFRDVAGVARAAAAGLTPDLARKVNVGNVHFAAGRKPVTPSVFLDDGEVRALEALSARGFDVELRAIPPDSPLALAQIAERHRAAR
jgi:PTS system N-acetylgalactosamine-specific IIB component